MKYSIDSANCQNSTFLRSCQGCTDCFGCTNLVNKQYYIFNKPYTKDEYQKYMSEINLGSHKVVESMRERWEELVYDLIVKEYQGVNIENSSGNYLRNVKNCQDCYECDNSEDLRYSYCLEGVKDSMDYSYWGVNAERIYECQAGGFDIYNLKFCNVCWSSCRDLMYCDHTHHSKDCFGCVGLRNKQYCILNKQYSKEEYEALVPKLIEHMQKTGEWGEFFPTKYSLYGYNETLANEQIPLNKEEILRNGWIYKELEEKGIPDQKAETTDHISEVTDDILSQVLVCEKSGKAYKIIKPELDFYRRNGIPIPRLCPDERHERRLKMRNPRKLWDRLCELCQKSIRTSYSPDRPEKVYCEECYLKTVY